MWATFAVLLAGPAFAADASARKPGLWEVKTTIEGQGRAVTVQQCIDAATDQMLQASAGPFSAPLCKGREVTKSDAGMTIDTDCSLNGKAATAHAVVTGNFDSAYTMTVTAEGGALPPVKMTMEGKVAFRLCRGPAARRRHHGERHQGQYSGVAEARARAGPVAATQVVHLPDGQISSRAPGPS